MAFELPSRRYQFRRLDANLLRHGEEIGLIRLEKGDHRGEQPGIGGARSKLVRPNSGQVEQALRPALVAERCRKRGEGNSHRIIWCLGLHSLEPAAGR
jgi:hypothetical protein